jgi:hypothetical protein
MKNYSCEEFCEKLDNVDWNVVYTADDVDSAWNSFKNTFIEILDQVAPVKMVRLKQRTQPWIDNTILELLKKRDIALHNFRKSTDPTVKAEFKRELNMLRNKAQSLIKKAKSGYIRTKLEQM